MEDEIIKGKPIHYFVKDVIAREDYYLILTFVNGEKKLFNANVLLLEPIYTKLKDISFFLKAHTDGTTVVWDDELDIAPEYLYEHSIPYYE